MEDLRPAFKHEGAALLSSLSATAVLTIRAGVLQIEANRKHRQVIWDLIPLAFDLYAKAFLLAGKLTDELLEVEVVGFAFDEAVKGGWIQYPQVVFETRRELATDGWFAGRVDRNVGFHRPATDCELSETLGSYPVTPETKRRVLACLDRRIKHWRAELLLSNIASNGEGQSDYLEALSAAEGKVVAQFDAQVDGDAGPSTTVSDSKSKLRVVFEETRRTQSWLEKETGIDKSNISRHLAEFSSPSDENRELYRKALSKELGRDLRLSDLF